MRKKIQKIFQESIDVKQKTLIDNQDIIIQAVQLIVAALKKGGKLLIFGNGGSAADSQHMAAEFTGRFLKERAALPAIALTTDTSALTALGNDYGFDTIFARQVEALGKKGDVALGISTSGNSGNVIKAFQAAKKKGIATIALTGNTGGKLKALADINLIVPSKQTARVQESHLCIEHTICELVEEQLS